MAIDDLKNTANLYDSYQQLKIAQGRLIDMTKANMDAIAQIVVDIEKNPEFSKVNDAEKKYFIEMKVAAAEANVAVASPTSPEVAVK